LLSGIFDLRELSAFCLHQAFSWRLGSSISSLVSGRFSLARGGFVAFDFFTLSFPHDITNEQRSETTEE
jgi:hypothetical protein